MCKVYLSTLWKDGCVKVQTHTHTHVCRRFIGLNLRGSGTVHITMKGPISESGGMRSQCETGPFDWECSASGVGGRLVKPKYWGDPMRAKADCSCSSRSPLP